MSWNTLKIILISFDYVSLTLAAHPDPSQFSGYSNVWSSQRKRLVCLSLLRFIAQNNDFLIDSNFQEGSQTVLSTTSSSRTPPNQSAPAFTASIKGMNIIVSQDTHSVTTPYFKLSHRFVSSDVWSLSAVRIWWVVSVQLCSLHQEQN